MDPFGHSPMLFRMPETRPAELFRFPGVKQLFYSGPAYRGRPTEVFACYGLPEGASPERPVPGVVLVHGGGATALADWVALWVKRGYAAISMDTCGCVPGWSVCPWFNRDWPKHPAGGPSGWSETMHESALPAEEQWPYHAVHAVTAAHTFLRSLPGVDSGRIGVSGISWGGVLTCLAAGVDPRYKFAVPVYGCGFFDAPGGALGHDNLRLTPELRKRWFELWDPGHRLDRVSAPMLFFSGSNDFAFPLDALQNSYRTVPGEGKRLSVRLAYPHNHTECWVEETVFDFAAAALEGRELPALAVPVVKDGKANCRFSAAGRKIASAALLYTRASGAFPDRVWNRLDIPAAGGELSAALPPHVTAFFFSLFTADGCCYSSELSLAAK